ncbi:MAG: response regulator [Proteobacteria bacterium]|nr:response regulator [Pseudomonadota bacterium]
MIIGNNTLFRANLAQRLFSENYTVYSSDQGSESKKMINRKNIDVALLCLMELKRNGLSILSMIKRFRPLVEVIILNNSKHIGLSIEGMKLGAFDDFLLPFDKNSMLIRIQEAVERKRRRTENKETRLKKYEKIFMAKSLAEVGEHDIAKNYLDGEKTNENPPE